MLLGSSLLGSVPLAAPGSLAQGALRLTPPIPGSGLAGDVAQGGVLLFTGSGSVAFTLTCTPAASISPASGTAAPGVPVAYTITPVAPGVHVISVSNTVGIANPAPAVFYARPIESGATPLRSAGLPGLRNEGRRLPASSKAARDWARLLTKIRSPY